MQTATAVTGRGSETRAPEQEHGKKTAALGSLDQAVMHAHGPVAPSRG
jgi:hypothetical protein